MKSYVQRLHDACRRKQTAALVGLDPRWELLPRALREQGGDSAAGRAMACESFCRAVIDVVAPLVPAVKPQAAFFEEFGPAGVNALANVIRAARDAGLVVIADAKRGDIGNTAQAYAYAFLAGEDPDSAPFAADALTVNPYLGVDALEPFVARAQESGGGVYVLVRTSNPGARDFQDRAAEGLPLYRAVAASVDALSRSLIDESGYGPVGAVVGATYPAELAELRQAMPQTPLLVPGYGSQGGTSQDVRDAFDAHGLGAVVNSSRGILYAFRQGPFAETFGEAHWERAVDAATRAMIDDLAQHTRAGRLRTAG